MGFLAFIVIKIIIIIIINVLILIIWSRYECLASQEKTPNFLLYAFYMLPKVVFRRFRAQTSVTFEACNST